MEYEPYRLEGRKYICKVCRGMIGERNEYCLRSDLHEIYRKGNLAGRRIYSEDMEFLPASFLYIVHSLKPSIIQTRGSTRTVGDIMLF